MSHQSILEEEKYAELNSNPEIKSETCFDHNLQPGCDIKEENDDCPTMEQNEMNTLTSIKHEPDDESKQSFDEDYDSELQTSHSEVKSDHSSTSFTNNMYNNFEQYHSEDYEQIKSEVKSEPLELNPSPQAESSDISYERKTEYCEREESEDRSVREKREEREEREEREKSEDREEREDQEDMEDSNDDMADNLNVDESGDNSPEATHGNITRWRVVGPNEMKADRKNCDEGAGHSSPSVIKHSQDIPKPDKIIAASKSKPRRSLDTDRPYGCEVYGKAFRNSSHLSSHRRIHTGERPYECRVCGKRFTVAFTLKTHMMSHNNERPFECSECGKGCVSSSDLTVHMRVHTGDRPYQCEFCSKRFSHGQVTCTLSLSHR